MNTKTIYVRNFDVFSGIKHFLIIARDYHEEEGNINKQKKANEYLNFIIPQQPLESGGFELKVPADIDKFAKESSIGVDDRMWETLDTDAEMRGLVNTGEKLLTNL